MKGLATTRGVYYFYSDDERFFSEQEVQIHIFECGNLYPADKRAGVLCRELYEHRIQGSAACLLAESNPGLHQHGLGLAVCDLHVRAWKHVALVLQHVCSDHVRALA